MLTYERVRELFNYDPETGVLRYKIRRGCRAAGSIAGSVRYDGYIAVAIDWRVYQAHRVAWLWMTGAFPKDMIDHKDGDPGNNRWNNLREATLSQNGANSKKRSDSKMAFKGVEKRTDKFLNKPYRASVMLGGKHIRSKYFATPEEAHAAYLELAREHFGEFARGE